VQTLTYHVDSLSLSFSTIYKWFLPQNWTYSDGDPTFELRGYSKMHTLDQNLRSLQRDKGVLQFIFRGA